MKFNIAICDDEQNASTHLVELLRVLEVQHDYGFSITVYNSSKQLLDTYQTPHKYDILFLDVEMPELSGLELARIIRNLPDSAVKIIFTSNYPQYMQDSFNVSAFQYLQKPIQIIQFGKKPKNRIV